MKGNPSSVSGDDLRGQRRATGARADRTPADGGQAPPAVSLPASLSPVPEGASVTITATLSAVLSDDVDVPVRVTRDTSEED